MLRFPPRLKPRLPPVESVVNAEIRRASVEAMRLEPVLKNLRTLLVPPLAAQYRSSIWLWISGYEADPRNLHEIPEVRAFVRQLDDAFPYLPWFLHPQGFWLFELVGCCCRLRMQTESPGKVGIVVEPDSMNEFLLRHIDALGELWEKYGVPEGEALLALNQLTHAGRRLVPRKPRKRG